MYLIILSLLGFCIERGRKPRGGVGGTSWCSVSWLDSMQRVSRVQALAAHSINSTHSRQLLSISHSHKAKRSCFSVSLQLTSRDYVCMPATPPPVSEVWQHHLLFSAHERAGNSILNISFASSLKWPSYKSLNLCCGGRVVLRESRNARHGWLTTFHRYPGAFT